MTILSALNNVLLEQAEAYGVIRSPYALLDFPSHPNVGDSAIWLGELAHLEAVIGSPPAFVCANGNFDAGGLRKALPSGPIFMHGGGNFGDIWPDFHLFRESVIEQFPDRRIIQLPQSIHFTSPSSIDRTAAIIKRHGNFILFVRDRRSFELARASFDCPVHLAPDAAFALGSILRPVSATHKLLLLLRTDKESAGHYAALPPSLPAGAIIADWLKEDPNFLAEMKRRTVLSSPLRLGLDALSKSSLRKLLFRNLAQARVSRGIKLLSSAEYVITDRLHCHILCMLLRIPHVVLDNTYGKLSSFIQTWTKDYPLLRIAPSLDKAIDLFNGATLT